MGTDIHVYAEKRVKSWWDKSDSPGVWMTADKWSKNEEFVIGDEGARREWVVDSEDRVLGDRNYYLFGILAGLRWQIEPIAKPKGMPEDASAEVARAHKLDGSDAHSASWFTLKEILAFDWSAETAYSGYVPPFVAEEYMEEGIKPAVWETEQEGRLVKLDWTVSHAEFCEEMVQKTIPALQRIAAKSRLSEENVRIVFWFDN